MAADVHVVARTGWTAAEAHRALLEAAPAGPFDAATVQVGVNDQYRGGDPRSYRDDLAALLEAVSGSAGRIAVLSIPDWSVTPHAAGHDREAAAAGVDAHNRQARLAADAAGAAWVDLTEISRRAATRPDLLTGDGLHPSRVMYEQWLGPILAAIVPEGR